MPISLPTPSLPSPSLPSPPDPPSIPSGVSDVVHSGFQFGARMADPLGLTPWSDGFVSVPSIPSVGDLPGMGPVEEELPFDPGVILAIAIVAGAFVWRGR